VECPGAKVAPVPYFPRLLLLYAPHAIRSSRYTLLTKTCRRLFRTLSYPQILLKTLFKIGERQVSPLSFGSDRLAADW
jgi:hypothetical protein